LGRVERDLDVDRNPAHADGGSASIRAQPLQVLPRSARRARHALRYNTHQELSEIMFVIELIYKATLAEIDATMKAHVVFLKKYYAAGHFLVSGRKIPRDGGIIVAVAKNREQIDAIVREDPFVQRGLADFRIIEFRASQKADDIQMRIEKSASGSR
jgi:uncharacterized protein YciI